VVVRVAPLPHVGDPLDPASPNPFAGGTPQALRLRVPGEFAAEVRDGVEIVIDPAPGADLDLIAECLVGPLLGFALIQRRFLVLHASCVSVDGCGVAFAGYSGQGKSTTAAALLARGHSLVSDDVTALTADHSILSGTRRMNLWPAAATAVGLDPERLEQCIRRSEKRRHYAPGPPSDERVPLRRLYVLGAGELAITAMPLGEGIQEVVRHTYAIWAIRATGQYAQHFPFVCHLLRAGVVRRLNRPLDLERLPELARLIEADVRSDRDAGPHGPTRCDDAVIWPR
jgi:hypothetical protein